MTYEIKHKLKKSFIHIPLFLLIGFFLSPTLTFASDGETSADERKPEDKEITSFVQMEFIVQDGVNWNDIEVVTNDGIVTLSGVADNILEKERSIHIAKSIKGVRAVVNKIQVRDANVPDLQLERNIENALLTDPATDSYEVNVSASNGKVILTGKVDSWQEKQLSETVAKGVAGVQEVENNIYFEFTKNRTDHEIKSDIEQTLNWDIRVDDGLITVEVKNGKVTLTGTVGSAAEQSQAVVDSWVAGVQEVNDTNLIISKWARDEVMRDDKYVAKTDAAIKKAVKDAFLYDPRVVSFNPEVEVSNGKVTLTGVVDNLKARRAAEIDARNVVGVWKVDNLLKVSGMKGYETDLSILRNVENSLALNPYLDEYDLNVIVKNGVVTLDGNVDNYLEKFEAEDVTSAIYGVRDVKNKLNVEMDALPYAYDYNNWFYYPYGRNPRYSYSPTQTDWEIENNIQSQLWWSPFVNLSDISIDVDNGIANLEGTVDTWNEYYMAEKNAFEGGALGVNNDLEVSSK
jgi:osmotically-inducible protein OsmY